MPADPAKVGTGARRQGRTGPERDDDRNRSIERAIEEERTLESEERAFERGRQPGAHGMDAPHRPVKPGTRSTIEEARPQRGRSD